MLEACDENFETKTGSEFHRCPRGTAA